MTSTTKSKIIIKHCEDGVYDIYKDGQWVASRGSTDNVLTVVKGLLYEAETPKVH